MQNVGNKKWVQANGIKTVMKKGCMCPLHFFTYATARRCRCLSGPYMYMFSQHRKLDFCTIISFISGLECLQKLR